MVKNNSARLKFSIILIFACLILSSGSLDANPKKYYKKKKTIKNALTMIRKNSDELCRIAGLEPIEEIIEDLEYDDSELLDDPEEAVAIQISSVYSYPNSVENSYHADRITLENKLNEDSELTDINEFNTLWLDYLSEDEDAEFTDSGIDKKEMIESIFEWLGTPYKFGRQSKRSVDCSAYVRAIFRETADIEIPRTARYQYNIGDKIKSRKDLQFGDLVFFHTRPYARATHVGIYLGDNLFTHASSRNGVTVSSLKSSYYNRKYIGARRIQLDDILELQIDDGSEFGSILK